MVADSETETEIKVEFENEMEVKEKIEYNKLKQVNKDIKGCDFKCDGCKLAAEPMEELTTHMKNEHVKF